MPARAVDPTVKAVRDVLPGLADCPKVADAATIAAIKQAAFEAGLGDKLYSFQLDDQQVVFRPLMRGDWNEIQAFVQTHRGQVTPEALEQKVCEKAILWPIQIVHPLHWERQRAGLQRTLAQYIQARSGFIDENLDQSAYMKFEPLYTLEVGPKPDPQVVEELKASNPDWPLKLVMIEGDYYVIRPISRSEWRSITSAGEDQDYNLLTAQRAVVWSKEYPEKPNFNDKVGGLVPTLADAIMAFSGFLLTQPVVEEL